MSFPWILSMCVGFLSLSQEILWMRYVGFAGQSIPWAFSLVLTVYLLGIARGAMIGRDDCARTTKLYTAAGKALLLGGVLDMVSPFIAPVPKLHMTLILFVYLCALLKSIAFPIAHHLGASPKAGKTGTSVSRVYFINIIGSSLGPVLTGFWLLDHATLQTAMQLMGALTCLLGFLCIARENKGSCLAWAGAATVAAFAALLLTPALVHADSLTRTLACYQEKEGNLHYIAETKSGIIHTATASDGGGDYTYGGNVYDGRASINTRVDSNLLERVFVLAALKPRPARVLVIGMSTGAWVRILTGFPGVKRIDVVEINPGYLQLIPHYPEISPFLKDPRVHIHIDDGRRWLKRHPDEKFDLIAMNTTWHWRNYITNLLSQQFLRLARQHLTPDGLIAYNSTDSPDVLPTAESVFPHAYGYENFVIAGNRDFRSREREGRAQLLGIRLDGKPVFNPANAKDAAFIAKTLSVPLVSSAQQRPFFPRDGEIITDWNMITEYKYGRAISLFCK